MLHISFTFLKWCTLPFVYLQETRKICKIHNESFHMCFKPIKHVTNQNATVTGFLKFHKVKMKQV